MDTPHENGPSHRDPAKGKSLGISLGQWISDCFPVWADTPPYDRHHGRPLGRIPSPQDRGTDG
ncbi:MAG TPA: hypothetical protein VK558_00900 [Patescibacteria group bacterium]|nr:hypothetical protein [Patescibacteria group bacterium]